MNAFHEIGTGLSTWRNADVEKVRRNFRIALETDTESKSVIIELLRNRVPIHCGGMSDPFQKREWDLGLTKELIKISKEYNYPIVFSTKTASLPDEYYALLDKRLHAFQVSIMGWSPEYIKRWEGNTATAQERAEFVQLLRKDFGIWCSVRIQPIINKWEAVALMLALRDIPSYYSLEHLHVIADSWAGQEALLKYCKGSRSFIQKSGITEFKTEVKRENIKFLTSIANRFGVKVGSADNDLHALSQSRCCCGTDTIGGAFDNYLKFNECYMSTGRTDVGALYVPKSNVRRHMNIGKGKPTVFVEDVVKQYVKDNINLIPLEYRASVEKQLFGTARKKLF
jgi:DNA repair photolyase